MSLFGTRLKELREQNGLTQLEMAKKLASTQKNISNWENSVSEPSCDVIVEIANCFKVPMDELFGRGNYVPDPQNIASAKDRGLAKSFRHLSEEQKKLLADFINSFCKK